MTFDKWWVFGSALVLFSVLHSLYSYKHYSAQWKVQSMKSLHWRLFIEEYGERAVQWMSNFVAVRMSFHRALVISHESWPMIIDRAAWTSWSFRGFLKTWLINGHSHRLGSRTERCVGDRTEVWSTNARNSKRETHNLWATSWNRENSGKV